MTPGRGRVLFYVPFPPPDRKHYVPFHQGVALLAALLKRDGYEVTLRIPSRLTPDDVRADGDRVAPDVIFVSLATPQAPLLRPIAQTAAERGIPLLVGGPHPTFVPEEVLAVPGVTAVCCGEGEQAALAFLRGEEACPGLVYPGDPVTLGALADVASLPFPDRAVFAACPDFRLERTHVGHEFAASRGCPFRCTYCTNGALRRRYGPGHLRRRPVEDVLNEVAATLSGDPDVRIVGFHDDVFTADRRWLTEFAATWRKNIGARFGVRFWVNAHPEHLDEERVLLLARAGCTRVHMGVESGSEELREQVLGRRLSNQVILEASRRLERAGIRLVTFVMLGAPGETEGTYRETVALLRRVSRPRASKA